MPISVGKFITVKDNAVELEDGRQMNFTDTADILEVVSHQLWVLPRPALYYYRLDILLKSDLQTSTTTKLTVTDLFENIGVTNIIINVSDS